MSCLPGEWEAAERVGGYFLAPRLLRAEYTALPGLPSEAELDATALRADVDFEIELAWLLRLGAGGEYVRRGSSRRFHRVYPTSGNLQSVVSHVVDPARRLGGRSASHLRGVRVLHYDPVRHALGPLATIAARGSIALNGVFLALTSVPARQAVKYGPRGQRYAWLDLGHALAALVQAAQVLGWRCALVPSRRRELQTLLDLDSSPDFAELETEVAGVLLYVQDSPFDLDEVQGLWQALTAQRCSRSSVRAPSLPLADARLAALLRDAYWALPAETLSARGLQCASLAEPRAHRLQPAPARALLQRRTPDHFEGGCLL
ncbi:MAG: hypothetical protein ABI895_22515, partial [Deltaproteobacteria bacterium]